MVYVHQCSMIVDYYLWWCIYETSLAAKATSTTVLASKFGAYSGLKWYIEEKFNLQWEKIRNLQAKQYYENNKF